MLQFVDQPRVIKILRSTTSDAGKNTRLLIGTIDKIKAVKNLAKSVKPTAEESAAIESALEVLRRSRSIRRQCYALDFPEIAREVMEYFEGSASRTERDLIAVAVLEAARKVRKFDKAAA